MKFTVNKLDLMKKLGPAMGNVSNKNNVPAIEGVHIVADESGKIQITTYDLDKGFRAYIPANVDDEGSCIINAQRLHQTMRVMPDDDITFDIDDKYNCTISSGKSVFTMSAAKGEDFPNIPDFITERGFTVSSEILKKLLSKVAHSIAVSDNRPMLCGAFIKVNMEQIEVVSCDSYRLSKCNQRCEITPLSVDGDVNYSFILPGYAMGEIMKNLSEGDEDILNFYLSRKHAILTKGDATFFTRLIDSEYINYNKLIPEDNDIVVKVDRERLLGSLERANIIAEEKIQGSGKSFVKLSIEGHYMDLSSLSVRGGFSDEMDVVHEGGSIEIAFNCRYLIDEVKAAEGESIIMKFKSANQAVTIEAAEIDDSFSYFYLILPVRMNEQNKG